jgi:hypothetical protein
MASLGHASLVESGKYVIPRTDPLAAPWLLAGMAGFDHARHVESGEIRDSED